MVDKIFISCSRHDKNLAEGIYSELLEQEVNPWIYIKHLTPGRVALKEIDAVLAEASYVLGIVTENYLDSFGSTEAYSVIQNEKFIPLFFCDIQEIKKKSPIIGAVQGYNFKQDYENSLRDLVEFLKSRMVNDSKKLLSRVEGEKTTNPFRRTRAEFFRDNFALIAKAFAAPEKEKYDLIQDSQPIFIFAGRGCGKTMILKSLTPEVLVKTHNVNSFKELREKGICFIGIYMRLDKGCLAIYDYNILIELGLQLTHTERNQKIYKKLLSKLNSLSFLDINQIKNEPILMAGFNSVWTLSLNELNLKIIKTILTELKKLSSDENQIIIYDSTTENRITKEISRRLCSTASDLNNFDDLIRFIEIELSKISKYIQDLCTPNANPISDWCRPDIKFLDEIIPIFNENIEDLNGVPFFLLFDEFENLRHFQQTIIIEWVKTAEKFIPKIASKFDGMHTNMTLQGQAIQFGQDCPLPIELDYNFIGDSNKKSQFQDLLCRICENLLKIENYPISNIKDILEEPKVLEFNQTEIDEKIKAIREYAKLEYQESKIKEYRGKLQLSAIFRLLKDKGLTKKKEYAGFNTFSYLSSGIIRIFLNLIGMSFYKAEEDGLDLRSGEKISIIQQTWAANVVSRAWLESIPANFELKDYGDLIYRFVIDIGDLLRERLLNHPTEPETLSITLENPIKIISNITEQNGFNLNSFFSYAERESILYKRKETTSLKPKQSVVGIRTIEYILNRIYCPILELSYRTRWGRNKMTITEINNLLNPDTRKETVTKLKKRIAKEDLEYQGTTLFDFQEGLGNE